MLYSSNDRVLIETVAPGLCRSDGRPLNEEALVELGKLVGATLKDGPVEKVAVVFMMEDEARGQLDACKRYGLEVRAFVAGREQVLLEGGRVQQSEVAPLGPLLPILREDAWPHVSTTPHRRLMTGPANKGPWLTFGFDSPGSVLRLSAERQGARSLADVEKEALDNLRKRKLELKSTGSGGVVLVDEYGSEAILLPELMREAQAKLGCEMMAVGVPKEGGFVASDAIAGVEALLLWTKKLFEEAKGRRVSVDPFLVKDGQLLGFVSGTFKEVDSQQGKKPWWKFW